MLEGLTDDDIRHYLRNRPDILEQLVMDEVEMEQLERWMIRRTQKAKKLNFANRKTSLSRWKFCVSYTAIRTSLT